MVGTAEQPGIMVRALNDLFKAMDEQKEEQDFKVGESLTQQPQSSCATCVWSDLHRCDACIQLEPDYRCGASLFPRQCYRELIITQMSRNGCETLAFIIGISSGYTIR